MNLIVIAIREKSEWPVTHTHTYENTYIHKTKTTKTEEE